ncbi:hypothetical protein [Rhizobium leguminosarum]|jgi:hypothetical protein|nr:hypothetical protein [Rhizobium leguminosarum]
MDALPDFLSYRPIMLAVVFAFTPEVDYGAWRTMYPAVQRMGFDLDAI